MHHYNVNLRLTGVAMHSVESHFSRSCIWVWTDSRHFSPKRNRPSSPQPTSIIFYSSELHYTMLLGTSNCFHLAFHPLIFFLAPVLSPNEFGKKKLTIWLNQFFSTSTAMVHEGSTLGPYRFHLAMLKTSERFHHTFPTINKYFSSSSSLTRKKYLYPN